MFCIFYWLSFLFFSFFIILLLDILFFLLLFLSFSFFLIFFFPRKFFNFCIFFSLFKESFTLTFGGVLAQVLILEISISVFLFSRVSYLRFLSVYSIYFSSTLKISKIKTSHSLIAKFNSSLSFNLNFNINLL